MKVAVIGSGYVGLTTGVSLAYLGHQVTCVDIDEQKVERLRSGILPIYEPGLHELLIEVQDRLDFTTSYSASVYNADIVFFAVGTPANPDGSPNLAYLFSAVGETIRCLRTKETVTVLVNKSTVPVGTSDQIAALIADAGLDSKVGVASNPEFLRQGRAVSDTLYPDRIVAGGNSGAIEALKELYAGIVSQSFPVPEGLPRPEAYKGTRFIGVDRRSAELAKYAANAFLAMKISFINEIANVCDLVDANVLHIADIIGTDPRIGPSFLQAGIGYGGSCFPKDTRALQYIADTNGYDFKLMSAVIEVNIGQKFKIVNKLRKELKELEGRKIAVLGLTFKPETDDLREAPSIPIIQALVDEGADVYVHDPIAVEKARALLSPSVHLSSDVTEVLRDAEAALLITEWPEYLNLDAEWLRSVMRRPLFIDGRNALGEDRRSQLEYRGIGISDHSKTIGQLQVNR